MDGMNPNLQWSDVVLRLAVTVVAGLVIGYNRSEQGKAAGMRTTVLVCLAASVSMIQVNLLLPTVGRQPTSFVMNDVMRLPLGILTGVGFIGAGAILRRDTMVVGVTTAATLWLVTVIGLCVGGGQIALALAATALGLFALWGLKWFEAKLHHKSHAQLTVSFSGDLSDAEIFEGLDRANLKPVGRSLELDKASGLRTLSLRVAIHRKQGETETPDAVRRLAQNDAVRALTWSMPDD